MSDGNQVRMLRDDDTHKAGDVGTLTTRTTGADLHWIQFPREQDDEPRGAWCYPDEYEPLEQPATELTPALAKEPHLVIAAATDAFNESLARVAAQVATHCGLSISVISDLLVTGWAFKPGADGEPHTWTSPTERSN